MKTAVVYARYSSNNQTEQSIEGQLRVCQKYASDNDLFIVNTYIDRATTGTNDNRAAFQQMLADSEKNVPWEIVLVYAIDRFGRNAIEVALNKQRLHTNGKTLISATQRTSTNIDGSKNLDGILLENVYIGIAEYYSAELSQKVLRGQNENRRKGLHCGGKIAYGYFSDNRKLKIVEEEAEIIRFIYEQYSLGLYVSQILHALREKGLSYHGRPFHKGDIYRFLNNRRYVGIYEHKGEIFDDIYPQIVSQDIFDKVQERLLENRDGKRSTSTVYLLRSKLRCGYCGAIIGAECGTSHTGAKSYYYKCTSRKKAIAPCQKTTMRKECLENFILDLIVDELSKPKLMKTLVDSLLKLQTEIVGENYVLQSLKNEKRQVESALANLLKAIEQGIFSNTTNKRLHELEDRLSELDCKIAVEESKQSFSLTRTQIEVFYKQSLLLQPQALINALIKKIVLYNDKIEIYFQSPLHTSPDDNRGFSFYATTVDMVIPVQHSDRVDTYHMELQLYI